MELLEIAKLSKHNLSIELKFSDIVKDRERACIGILFTASWCNNSRKFMPFLAKFFKSVADERLIIIMASFDRSEQEYKELLAAYPDWYALPWRDPIVEKLEDLYTCEGIPDLVVLSSDGTVISRNGRDDIMLRKRKAWTDWNKLMERPA